MRLSGSAVRLFPGLLCAILFLGAQLIALPARASQNSDFLKKLVELPVPQVQEVVSRELESLGFKVEHVLDPLHKNFDMVVGTKPGLDSRYLTLVMHADTVFDSPSVTPEMKISADGKTAYGPGVTDDKGGIVVALAGLKRFFETNKQSKYGLRVLCSPNEEVGSTAFVPRFQEFAKDTYVVLGFEGALPDGSLVGARRGNRWYHIKSIGRESDTGRDHKNGANACVELAHKLDQVSQLTDYKRQVTVSVGLLSGGKDKYNIVCGQAEAKVDTRFSELADGNRLHAQFEKILAATTVRAAADGFGVKTTYEIADYSAPFSATPRSKPVFESYLKALNAVEAGKFQVLPSGGAADTNAFSGTDAIILDGLGPVGGKMHTHDEFVYLPSLDTRAEALARFLADGVFPAKGQ